jgi:hypothetical protein
MAFRDTRFFLRPPIRSNDSTVDCCSTGTVNDRSYVGGLTGFNAGLIVNCYSTAAIGGHEYVGGLAGVDYGSIVANSCSTGAVRGESHTGGLIGDHDDSDMSNCFWDA